MVENQKLFRVSRLKDHSLELVLEEKICATVDKLAPSLDGIIVSDFVYGVISNNVFEHVTKVAEKEGYDMIVDIQALQYGKPEYNISEKVIKELK